MEACGVQSTGFTKIKMVLVVVSNKYQIPDGVSPAEYQRCRKLCIKHKCGYPEAREKERGCLQELFEKEMERYPEP
jgi:hypothetical protein